MAWERIRVLNEYADGAWVGRIYVLLFTSFVEFVVRVEVNGTVVLYCDVLLVKAASTFIRVQLVGVIVTRCEFTHFYTSLVGGLEFVVVLVEVFVCNFVVDGKGNFERLHTLVHV